MRTEDPVELPGGEAVLCELELQRGHVPTDASKPQRPRAEPVACEASKRATSLRSWDAVDGDPRAPLQLSHRTPRQRSCDPVDRPVIETVRTQRYLQGGDARARNGDSRRGSGGHGRRSGDRGSQEGQSKRKPPLHSSLIRFGLTEPLTRNIRSYRTYVPVIACLLIPGFDLRAALRRQPGLALRPAALSPGEGKEPLLGPVTAAAEGFGVRPGMRMAEALATCPELVLVVQDPASMEQAWE